MTRRGRVVLIAAFCALGVVLVIVPAPAATEPPPAHAAAAARAPIGPALPRASREPAGVAATPAAPKRFPAHGLFEGGSARPTTAAELRCRSTGAEQQQQQQQQQQRACLPLVLGISCVHCGSSSLASYLNAHPQLSYGGRKEHHFFPYRHPRSEHSPSPLLGYAGQFLSPLPASDDEDQPAVYGLDFTPGYLSKSAQDKQVIVQVAELPAETKFIVILKKPEEFMKGRLRSKATVQCLEDEQCWSAVRRMCCQHIQLEPWLEKFDRSRFFFVRSEDLMQTSQRCVATHILARAA